MANHNKKNPKKEFNKKLLQDPIIQAVLIAQELQAEEDWDNWWLERFPRLGDPRLKYSGPREIASVGDITNEPEFFQKLAA